VSGETIRLSINLRLVIDILHVMHIIDKLGYMIFYLTYSGQVGVSPHPISREKNEMGGACSAYGGGEGHI
jgi:hypothetical protein